MEALLTRSWIEEFRRAAAEKRADLIDREKLDRLKRLKREQEIERHQIEVQRERDDWSAIETALAPVERVQAFRLELDDYDTVTVEALMENREALDAVQRRIERMLDEAYVLPDGRRVFKTEDGKHVYDEHGQAVPPDIIDPNQIDNHKPSYEAFRAAHETRERLNAERQQLLDYQRQLDEARARLDRGEITNGELTRLQRDLADQMPEVIRHKLQQKYPELAQPADPRQSAARSSETSVPGQETQTAAALPVAASVRMPDTMDTDMQNGPVRAPSAPKV